MRKEQAKYLSTVSAKMKKAQSKIVCSLPNTP